MTHKPSILVVDDEESMRRFFSLTLEREGYQVDTAESVATGCAAIKGKDYHLVLSDIRLGDGQGLEILSTAKKKDPELPVLMMTAYASAETAVEAMKLGANDYLSKPFNVDEVRIVVKNNIRARDLMRENRELRAQLEQKGPKVDMVYQSSKMQQVMEVVERVSKMDTTILVTGESGTGKELIMRAIHTLSPRSENPFLSVNCGALPENLFESELFGYEKGAFTGAEKQRKGLFESADKGTLFLDEIGELPLRMQIKLLRVLQEKTIRRVGGTEEIKIDVRVVAATNRDLAKEVEDGSFRQDLYYRINVIPVALPPLRARREDILLLIKHFLAKFAKRMGEPPKTITGQALTALERYDWPGNVRELEHTIERITALTPGEQIEVDNLPDNITDNPSANQETEVFIPPEGMDLEALLNDLRYRYMQRSLEMTGGVQSKSCELLGMSFRSFRYYYGKMKDEQD